MKIKYYTFLLCLTIFSSCSLLDICFSENSVYIGSNKRVNITLENPSNLKVGDTLWIRTIISKSIEGSDGNLHQIETGSINETVFMEIAVKKIVANKSVNVDFRSDFIYEIGRVYMDSSELNLHFNFEDNTSKNQLENYFGIVLNEPGEYIFAKIYGNNYFLNSYESDLECPDKIFNIGYNIQNGSDYKIKVEQ